MKKLDFQTLSLPSYETQNRSSLFSLPTGISCRDVTKKATPESQTISSSTEKFKSQNGNVLFFCINNHKENILMNNYCNFRNQKNFSKK